MRISAPFARGGAETSACLGKFLWIGDAWAGAFSLCATLHSHREKRLHSRHCREGTLTGSAHPERCCFYGVLALCLKRLGCVAPPKKAVVGFIPCSGFLIKQSEQ